MSENAPSTDAVLKAGQETLDTAEITKLRVNRLLDDADSAGGLRCPVCYGKAFRPAPVFKGDPEFTCVREDCQTLFRVIYKDGKVVKVESFR